MRERLFPNWKSCFDQNLYYILVYGVLGRIQQKKSKPYLVTTQEKFNLKDNLQGARKAAEATRGKMSQPRD